MSPFQLFVAFCLIGSVLGAVAWVFRLHWRRPSRFRQMVLNLTTVALTLSISFLVVETAFFFRDDSITYGFSLGMKKWMERHWRPVNALGFRDYNYSAADLQRKRVLLVVGDSLAAGHGIRNIDDRFSNRLGRKLGADWLVANVAANGWNTTDEVTALERFPVDPEVVVLAYYPNDIFAAANAEGFYENLPIERPSKWMSFLLDRSYFIDYYYWRIWRFSSARQLGNHQRHFIEFCFDQPKVWARHAEELNRFANVVEARGARLWVLGIPQLLDLQNSAPKIEKVLNLFEQRGVPTIDLTPHLKGQNPMDLIVNRMDAHPNVAVNATIAEILFDRIREKLAAPADDRAS